jgi:hypothetical protein
LGHAGLFFKGRKALPHFIERWISPKIHLGQPHKRSVP